MDRKIEIAYRQFERRCTELIDELTVALKSPNVDDDYPNAEILLANLHAWRVRARYNDLYHADRRNLGLSKSDLLFGRADAKARELEKFYVAQIYQPALRSTPKNFADQVCEHLRPLEAALLSAGIGVLFRGQAWSESCGVWVYFDCYLDRQSLRSRFRLTAPVEEHLHRGTHDGAEAGFVCAQHHDGVMGYYPDERVPAVNFR